MNLYQPLLDVEELSVVTMALSAAVDRHVLAAPDGKAEAMLCFCIRNMERRKLRDLCQKFELLTGRAAGVI